MKTLMLGVYNFNSYSRGRILYKGLVKNKVPVSAYLPQKDKYFKLTKRLLKKDYDILLVTGKFVLSLAWLLKPIHKKKIIFDVFISDYENLVIDRKKINKKSIKSKLLWLGDKVACSLADINILDTNEHITYFVKEFKLHPNKFKTVYVGSDEEIFNPISKKQNEKFLVEFHGTFIPLQGIEHIIKAAKILENESIQFKIIGTGQEYPKIIKLVHKLNIKNIEFTKNNIPIKELANEIQKADVCLGIFGNSIKTKNVIPNKAFETIASKKPLITSNTPAIKEIFTDKVNCLLCDSNNGKDLAEKILILKNNNKLKEEIASKGYKLFLNKFNIGAIGKNMKEIINEKS